MRRFHIFAVAALAMGLAACSEEKAEAPATPPAEEPAPATTNAAPPSTAPVSTSKSMSANDTRSLTEKACLDTVASETNESNVSVISYEFSEANSLVMVGVGPNSAPWRCLVANDGTVQEVSFTGNDGDGVDQSAAPSENPASADDGGGAMAGAPAAAGEGCPVDVSEADRANYPACN